MAINPAFEATLSRLQDNPQRWLVTGVAGFIGSNLLESLLRNGQTVVGLDNFSTGHRHNLDLVRRAISAEQWKRFEFIEGDIRDAGTCSQACEGVSVVLHQAALGSVPRSIANPLATNATNIDGFLNMLTAARDARVARFVYAASSSTYGDHPGLPKIEDRIGKPMSPYAVTKYVNELYAHVFALCYGMETIGLRYFNVFGARQDPEGAYAAVIPKWAAAILRDEPVYINGDGLTSRDFCFIANVVQANLLAATTTRREATNQVYNVAVGDQTTLNDLHRLLTEKLVHLHPELHPLAPVHRDFRGGDIRHSLADISKAQQLLGYQPSHDLAQGLEATAVWYEQSIGTRTQGG